MKGPFFTLGLVAVMARHGIAMPMGDNSTLVKRDYGLLCGNYQYTQQEAQDAYDEGIQRAKTGDFIQNGDQSYPGPFLNGGIYQEVDPGSCMGLALQEFPILPDNVIYNGGNAKTDRVVFAPQTDGTWVQCFVMTHTGAAAYGGFVRCT